LHNLIDQKHTVSFHLHHRVCCIKAGRHWL